MNKTLRLALGIRHIKPVWMQDYAPGFSMFTFQTEGFLSPGIAWFMNQDAPLLFSDMLKKGFKKGLSHVVSIETETHGMEASIGGIQRFPLAKYFDDPSYIVICREPDNLQEEDINQKLNYQRTLIGNDYDYGVFPWFAFMSLTGIQSFIKSLKRQVPIGHKNGARVCSTFEADGFFHTVKYNSIELFKEWNVLGIHVNRLFLDFKYKPFKIGRTREWL